jgi:hypothetical protein
MSVTRMIDEGMVCRWKNAWRIYEMGFPERPDMKAPGDLGSPFGAFFLGRGV